MKTDTARSLKIARNVLRHLTQNAARYTAEQIRQARVALAVARHVHENRELYQ